MTKTLLLLMLLMLFVPPTRADTVYTYTGDVFTSVTGVYNPGDRVTGSFVLSSAFVLNVPGGYAPGIYPIANFISSYDFTDGHQTFTQANSTIAVLVGFNPDGTPVVPTDGGPIPNSDWSLLVSSPTGEIISEEFGGDYKTFASDGSSQAQILSLNGTLYPGGPGTWTVQTPEPGVLLLLLAGTGSLILFRKK